MASTITYDRKIDGQTPDWIIEANSQKIIAGLQADRFSDSHIAGHVWPIGMRRTTLL